MSLGGREAKSTRRASTGRSGSRDRAGLMAGRPALSTTSFSRWTRAPRPRNPHSWRTRCWGSQNFRKRSLDASGRVDFYGPCTPFDGCGRKVLRPALFPDHHAFRRTCPLSRRASAWLSCAVFRGFGGCGRSGVNRLLTLYLVFASTMIARYGDTLSIGETHRHDVDRTAGTGPEATFARSASRKERQADGKSWGCPSELRKGLMRTGRRLRAGDEDSAMRRRYI